MVETVKFSDFTSTAIDQMVGLGSGANVRNSGISPSDATYILNTPNSALSFAQALSDLTTGILKSTSVTGIVSISPSLTSIDGLTTSPDKMIYTTASNVYAVTDLTLLARTLLSDSTSSAMRSTLGLGTASTKNATDNTKDNVISSGGSFTPGNILIAADTSGTAIDGGLPFGSGTVTQVDSGTGLTGGPITETGTLSFAPIAAHSLWVNNTSGTAVPSVISLGALTKVDDANVTLTFGGTPATSLINSVTMTLGWAGELSVTRGGTGNGAFTPYTLICAGTTGTGAFQNVSGVGTSGQVLTSQGAGLLPIWSTIPAVTPAALTESNDTNVTLTLGGTPSTALLQAVSITAGWTGQLSVPRGGTGIATTTAYGLITGGTTSTGAFQNSGTGTTGQFYLSNGSSSLGSWTMDLASGTTINGSSIATGGVNSSITSMTGLTGDVKAPSSVTMANAGAFRSDITNNHTALYQAYDLTNSSYKTFITAKSGFIPSLAISNPVNGSLTIDGAVIGSITPANGTFDQALANNFFGPIGALGASTGAFSTLSASVSITGTIGNVTPDSGTFTLVTATSGFSGSIGNFTPDDGTFTTLAATGQPTFSGATLIQKYVSANTSTAYTIDAVNGTFFDLTLNANCTITVTESITTGQTQFFNAKITQDGTGSHTLAFSGVTWAAGSSPVIGSSAGNALYLQFISINGTIYGFNSVTSLNATDITITDDTTTNATMYPIWVTASSGNLPAKVSSTKMTFNPSTATLTTTTFVGALTGNASTATTATNATNTAITDDTTTNATMYPTWVTANTGNLPQKVSSTKITFNPSTATLTTTTFVGALTGNATTATIATIATNATNIATTQVSTNASFFPVFVASSSSGNQAADIGTGLSFNPSTNTLTTTTFSGALSGNATTATTATTATNATNIATTQVSTNASFFPVFVASSSSGNQAADIGTGLSFNPNTNSLTTTTFVGALTGNASTATTATNTTNTAITDDTSTNATVYPTWVTANTGNLPQKVSSTKMTFNPSTGLLSPMALTVSGQATFTTPTIIQSYISGNAGATYTMDAVNGTYFDLTLNANCTITVTESIAASQSQFFYCKLTQDGTGGRTLAWSGVTWAAGSSPAMPTAPGAYLNLSFWVSNGVIFGFAQLQSTDSITLNALTLTTGILGTTSGSAITAGYVGEIVQANVAVGSAVSLTTATVTVITSISLSAGEWSISANPTFSGSGITATEFQAFYATASGTSTTGQDTYNTSYATPFIVAATAKATASISGYSLNTNTPVTVYLKVKATFSAGTCSAYGGISAERIA